MRRLAGFIGVAACLSCGDQGDTSAAGVPDGCYHATDLDGDGATVKLHRPMLGARLYCSPTAEDCDDTNPFIQIGGYWNRDGDGFFGEWVCTTHDNPLTDLAYDNHMSEHWGAPVLDCDDQDPEKGLWFFQDADADGFGDPDSRVCAPPGPGLTLLLPDCDDADPELPKAYEVWGDGFDADCDGADGTWADRCDLTKYLVRADPPCTGLDLRLERAYWCPKDCDFLRTVLRVANVGADPVTGTLRFSADGGEAVDFPVALAPGDATAVTTRGYGPFRIELLEGELCNVDDDWLEVFDCHIL